LLAAIDHIGTNNRLAPGGDPGGAAADVIIDIGLRSEAAFAEAHGIACLLPLPGDDQPQSIMMIACPRGIPGRPHRAPCS